MFALTDSVTANFAKAHVIKVDFGVGQRQEQRRAELRAPRLGTGAAPPEPANPKPGFPTIRPGALLAPPLDGPPDVDGLSTGPMS